MEIGENGYDFLNGKYANQILNDNELKLSLRLLVFNSIEWEIALTKIRRGICLKGGEGNISLKRKHFKF